MMNFNVVAALLCTCSWISVSVSEFHTVEVQSGEEVTVLCTNYTNTLDHIFWFRLDNGPNISCISSMSGSDGNVSFCVGFKNGKFNMTSNMTTLFLQIKSVDSSDSGLYFCGSRCGDYDKAVIVSATYLKVQEESVEPSTVTSVILGGLIIFLIIIVIVQVVKTRKLRADLKTEEQSPQHRENQGSADMNYAALNFHSKAKRNRRPASERELESNVVYAATR